MSHPHHSLSCDSLRAVRWGPLALTLTLGAFAFAACAGDRGTGEGPGGDGEPPQGELAEAIGSRQVCDADRIRKMYAIPGSLLLPEATTVEVETFDERMMGDPRFFFRVRRDDATEGRVALSRRRSCAPGSAACRKARCVGVGASEALDPGSELPVADVRVEVTVVDDDCHQTEEVVIECVRGDPEQTCDACLRQIDLYAASALGSACLGPTWLDTRRESFDTPPPGCQGDDACDELWRCQQRSLCHVGAPERCFCGSDVDEETCLSSDFRAHGECAAEIRRAFRAQFGRSAVDNAEVLEHLRDVVDPPTGFASLGIANALSVECLRPDAAAGDGPSTRRLLIASGLDSQAIDLCMVACFPPE